MACLLVKERSSTCREWTRIWNSLNVHVILLYACEVVEIEMPQSTFTLYKSVYAEQPEASEHTNCNNNASL